MKRAALGLLAFLVLTLAGCQGSTAIDYNKYTMPEPFHSGPYCDERLPYYDTLLFELTSFGMGFSRLVEDDEYSAYAQLTSPVDHDNAGIRDTYGVYSFIIHFDIPDETVRDLFVRKREFMIENNLPGKLFTDDDIDVIISKDDDAIAQRFVHENAIAIGGNVYSPKWIYRHTPEQYREAGIPAALLAEKMEAFLDDVPFTDKAEAALRRKVEAYVQMEAADESHP